MQPLHGATLGHASDGGRRGQLRKPPHEPESCTSAAERCRKRWPALAGDCPRRKRLTRRTLRYSGPTRRVPARWHRGRPPLAPAFLSITLFLRAIRSTSHGVSSISDRSGSLTSNWLSIVSNILSICALMSSNHLHRAASLRARSAPYQRPNDRIQNTHVAASVGTAAKVPHPSLER